MYKTPASCFLLRRNKRSRSPVLRSCMPGIISPPRVSATRRLKEQITNILITPRSPYRMSLGRTTCEDGLYSTDSPSEHTEGDTYINRSKEQGEIAQLSAETSKKRHRTHNGPGPPRASGELGAGPRGPAAQTSIIPHSSEVRRGAGVAVARTWRTCRPCKSQ